SWDCGLACTSMVLAGLGIPRSTLLDVSNMCSTRSIWTVDLVYIFRHYGVQDFTMYTSYIGVNWQNASKPFYRDSIAEDLKRVHSLFAKARACQVRIVPLVLAMDDICRFLASNRYAIIILVNFNLLKCTTCSKNKAKTSTIYDQQNEFEGHYIVLIGYDAARDVVYYRDPGVSDTLCSVKVDCLDKARMSCGTDCDLIVVKVM
ncbi:hypothetical protein BATDEDRAFT_12878, partial [Batrachochytrium dendrobatidis JAM81]